MESVNRQLCEFKEKGVTTELIEVSSLREELVVSTRQTEELKSSVEAKHLENDELRAEITWLKTQLKRLERETPVCKSVGLEESLSIRKTTGIEKPLSMTGSPKSGRRKAIVPAPLTPLLNQLPPISRFSWEEQPDDGTFQEWLEQFQSVATLVGGMSILS